MAITTLINTDVALRILKDHMNTEMVAAAKPIVDKALLDIEKAMRKKLGAIIVAYLDHSIDVDRFGSALRILIKHDHE